MAIAFTMSRVNGTIPRFLLPQLTWKATIPQIPELRPSQLGRISPMPPNHHHQAATARSISSSSRALVVWHHSRSHRFKPGLSSLIKLPARLSSGLPFCPFSGPPSGPASSSHSSLLSSYASLSTSFPVFSESKNTQSSTRRRYFSTTSPRPRDHHFDTLKCVQRLKADGFSEEQAKAMMLVLSDVIEESIQNLTRTMVLREGSYLFLDLPRRAVLLSSLSNLAGHRRRPQ